MTEYFSLSNIEKNCNLQELNQIDHMVKLTKDHLITHLSELLMNVSLLRQLELMCFFHMTMSAEDMSKRHILFNEKQMRKIGDLDCDMDNLLKSKDAIFVDPIDRKAFCASDVMDYTLDLKRDTSLVKVYKEEVTRHLARANEIHVVITALNHEAEEEIHGLESLVHLYDVQECEYKSGLSAMMNNPFATDSFELNYEHAVGYANVCNFIDRLRRAGEGYAEN